MSLLPILQRTESLVAGSEDVPGLRRLILTLVVGGYFDNPTSHRGPTDQVSSPLGADPTSNIAALPRRAGPANFQPLSAVAILKKGSIPIKKAVPGPYPLVVTSDARLSCDHYDFEGPAAVIPMVSSSGHGNASLKRLHYQEGKFAAGSILCVALPRDPSRISARFLYEYLSAYKDELLVSRMVGTANVSLTLEKIGEVPIPEVSAAALRKLNDLMALCDELEAAQTEREARRDRLRTTALRKLVAPDESKDSACFFLRNLARMITKPEHVAGVRQAIWSLAVRRRLVPRLHPSLSTTLGNLGRWGSGGTPSTSNREFYGGSIPWVVIGDLNEAVVSHTAQTITEAGIVNSSAKLIDPGTLLIAMYGASVGKLGIAGMRCATNQAIAHCVPDATLIERDYLFLLLRSIRSALVASAKGGAQPNISQTVLKSWQIELPTITEQRGIIAKVDQMMAIADGLEQSLAAEKTERGRLLGALLHDALADGLPGDQPEHPHGPCNGITGLELPTLDEYIALSAH